MDLLETLDELGPCWCSIGFSLGLYKTLGQWSGPRPRVVIMNVGMVSRIHKRLTAGGRVGYRYRLVQIAEQKRWYDLHPLHPGCQIYDLLFLRKLAIDIQDCAELFQHTNVLIPRGTQLGAFSGTGMSLGLRVYRFVAVLIGLCVLFVSVCSRY